MASSLITQLWSGTHTPYCQVGDHGAAHTKLHPALLKFRSRTAEVARAGTPDTQLQTSRPNAPRNPGLSLDRREMIAKMIGAAVLSVGAAPDAAHAAAGEIETAEEAATNPLIQKLLEKSRTNKTANDQARLEDYYKRNFKDYFEFVEGSVRNKKELTPAEKAIVEWLEKNK